VRGEAEFRLWPRSKEPLRPCALRKLCTGRCRPQAEGLCDEIRTAAGEATVLESRQYQQHSMEREEHSPGSTGGCRQELGESTTDAEAETLRSPVWDAIPVTVQNLLR